MQYAPIVIFAFNRLDTLRTMVSSLLKNAEVAKSDLYVFVDGARPYKKGESEDVTRVRDYVKSIEGFRHLYCVFSDSNKGLGLSVITGVTEVINQYGKVIVLEDDLELSENFLSYMNQGLDYYKNYNDVFSVCGWGPAIKKPLDYQYDYYFCVRSSSWGWGTWKEQWNSVDWELKDWNQVRHNHKSFNKWGGSDCFGMLNGWRNGKNKSWAIRFVYAQFIQKKVSVFPFISMVDNKGFDGKGTNCPRYCRTKWIFRNMSEKHFVFPPTTVFNPVIYKRVMHNRTLYHRIKAKLINIYLNLMFKLNNCKDNRL